MCDDLDRFIVTDGIRFMYIPTGEKILFSRLPSTSAPNSSYLWPSRPASSVGKEYADRKLQGTVVT